MGFLEIRAGLKFLNRRDSRRAACVREQPECVVLDVKPGVTPSEKPPVRVFLGTEPAQYRAERVFVWSIERARDPSRIYEIYLMKDLVGFDRRGWTTGFTNYRFAVPHLAGGAGRAIFNDVDEAYFGDPAELFDAEMGEHGYLATSDTETSVMLIDCARMAPVWPLEAAQDELKKHLLARTLETPGIRGDLPPEWTARDEDFVEGDSKLQHWTTLHTQPWRPVPQRFAYEPNPTGGLWFDLKRSADAAGYQVFSASRPSSRYSSLLERLRAAPRSAAAKNILEYAPAASGAGARSLAELIAEADARTLLDCQLGREPSRDPSAGDESGAAQPEVTRFDPAFSPSSRESLPVCDGVSCKDVLEYLPDEDVPWLVDELFARAGKFVYAVVALDGRDEILSDGSRLESQPRDPSWWRELFESAGGRHPDLHWTFVLSRRSRRGRESVQVRDGGHCFGGSPSVWVLTGDEREDNSQSLALADSLGAAYSRKDLRFTALARLPNRLLGATRIGVDRARSPELLPPWPDVVVASKRCCVPVARWIRRQSCGRTRLVQVGCPGGEAADLFDAVVTPAHYRLWPHPRRIETAVPLTRSTPKWPDPEDEHGCEDPVPVRHPRIALVLDSRDRRPRIDPESARRMGEEVGALARASGGCVRPIFGSGLDGAAAAALTRGLGDSSETRRPPTDPEDPTRSGGLADVDAVVVDGNSESLLASAATCGRPVYIYPTPERMQNSAGRLRSWVAARARTRPLNARGTPRPQQGLEYLCARLIERGFVRPPPDLTDLHETLYRLGIAAPFGAPLEAEAPPVLRESDKAATRVWELLGYSWEGGKPAGGPG